MLRLQDKRSLAIALRIWISHKRTLSARSDYYKGPEISKALSTVHSLYQMVKRDCREYDLKKLCSLILLHETSLFKILPCPKNESYTSQEEKLYQIITFAKQTLNK